MSSKKNNLVINPHSSGAAGPHFEAHVQASFVTLMLTGGSAPCLPDCSIVEIKLQGKYAGYETDDMIVVGQQHGSGEQRRLLAQIKLSIGCTKGNQDFSKVLQRAWRDYNNQRIFSQGKDRIALITGPISKTDSDSVRWLLEQARCAAEASEFYRKVRLARFTSNKKREKLEVIQQHLKQANSDSEVSEDDVYSFLRCFYLLGYDLGGEEGVTSSLLASHIAQFGQKNQKRTWSRIVDFVQTFNQNAGTITLKNLPEDLIQTFEQPIVTSIPRDLVTPKHEYDWNRDSNATNLALVNLIGTWDGKNAADITAVRAIAGDDDQHLWEAKAKELLHLPNSPLTLKNGQWWEIKGRADLWDSLGSRILDGNLDAFKQISVKVLTERDTSFDLPVQERYAASIYKKGLKRSQALRRGLASGLAILNNKSSALSHCSQNKANNIATLAIQEIFEGADWVLWGSLNSVLPLLAEAAPHKFLEVVDETLHESPCPFDELFAQEGDAITGGNYLTGLLWALEGLAWDEVYLVQACVALAKLAEHDPGGQWANRPINSLTTILLPWLPQTMAPFEKRKVAVETLCQESEEVGFELVISLLPDQLRSSLGSHKPLWRNIPPNNWNENVSKEEYWQQISFYSDYAVEMADQNTKRLTVLLDHLNNLAASSRERLLETLLSDEISSFPEDQKRLLRDSLMKLTVMHRRHSDTAWALDDETLSRIETVADNLSLTNPLELHQYLFSDREIDLYEERGNWEEQAKKLNFRRQQAVSEILQSEDISGVIKFASTVKAPEQVGNSLGCIADKNIDTILLPDYLECDNQDLGSFLAGYVWSRYHAKGWSWVDALDTSAWGNQKIAKLLCLLPFIREAWDRAMQWLGDAQGEYWSKTSADPYKERGDFGVAIEQLLEYKRARAAISCLGVKCRVGKPIDISLCVRSLLLAVSSTDSMDGMEEYYIVELIKFLQTNPEVAVEDVLAVEWAYLPLLDDHHGGPPPRTLENKLATDPDFFCKIVQSVYRSKNIDAASYQPSKKEQKIAQNAWRLLLEWKTPPGMQKNETFDDDQFESWFKDVVEICTKSGHLEVAHIEVGKVLIHCPHDDDGLWIRRSVARVLDQHNADDLRSGYHSGWYNSRGVHHVDPTGKPERDLAEQFRKKANDIENAGFQRLAAELRQLADQYDREADQTVSEYKEDQ